MFTGRTSSDAEIEGGLLAKPNYQFEKRQRDLAKKSKQEEKRRKKLEAKAAGSGGPDETTDLPGAAAQGDDGNAAPGADAERSPEA